MRLYIPKLQLQLLLLLLKCINRFVYLDSIQRCIYSTNRKLFASKGVVLGKNSIVLGCTFSSSTKGDKFKIGNNTTCTNVVFLGHDASPSLFIPELVIKKEHYLRGARCSYRKEIQIGDNCFIGFNTIILPGVVICNNCIIAAGSIVAKSISEPGVYAGNPVKKISELNDFIIKYKNILTHSPECF